MNVSILLSLISLTNWNRSLLGQILSSNHYLTQCWPRSMLPYDVTRTQWLIISIMKTEKHGSTPSSHITHFIYNHAKYWTHGNDNRRGNISMFCNGRIDLSRDAFIEESQIYVPYLSFPVNKISLVVQIYQRKKRTSLIHMVNTIAANGLTIQG